MPSMNMNMLCIVYFCCVVNMHEMYGDVKLLKPPEPLDKGSPWSHSPYITHINHIHNTFHNQPIVVLVILCVRRSCRCP